MFNVIFNNIKDSELGIKAIKRPNIPMAVRQYEEKSIPGRGGKLYKDLGTYDDIEISIPYNFVSSNADTWNTTFRQVKNWIREIKDRKLIFTDDLEYFYVVQKVRIDSSERLINRIGKFNLIFTCKPFSYAQDGQEYITLVGNTLYNDGCECEPIYRITGEGMCTLNVNNKTMTANVGQNIVVNTELQEAYKLDGTQQNTNVEGYYSNLKLIEGDNTISITNGFILEIKPNWRVI